MEKILQRILKYWRGRSLKYWLAMGMVFTIVPISTTSLLGFLFYHNQITPALIEISDQQRNVLRPLQTIQITLWDLSETVVDYSIDKNEQHLIEFDTEVSKITPTFEVLLANVKKYPKEVMDTLRAKKDWQEVLHFSEKVLSDASSPQLTNTNQNIIHFEKSMKQLGHDLDLVFQDVQEVNEKNHQLAMESVATIETFTFYAVIISILFAVTGVFIINKTLVSSMNKLALGALRLSQGQSEVEVNVSIPAELANVANAFNMMNKTIYEKEAALIKASITDELTGLINRREFNRIIEQELDRCKRYDRPFTLIMIDVDYFKDVNDTFGHLAGDQVLKRVANLIKKETREIDWVCRFGGEEFVILMPESKPDNAYAAAERIRSRIESAVIELDNNEQTQVTVSLGISGYSEKCNTVTALVNNADTALYKSKINGRNRITQAD